MPAPAPAPQPPAAPGHRLAHPQAANDLLMYRLNRLIAVAGSLVVRLCEGGYGITRDAMPGDRRQARLSLTSAGQAVHDELFPQVKALNQELLAGLGAEAVAGLDQALADMQRRAEALVATRTDVPRTYRLRGGRHVD